MAHDKSMVIDPLAEILTPPTISKCTKPLWIGSGMPGGTCDEDAFGEQKYYREYSVGGHCCPHHGGPSLAEYIAGQVVVRFDGSPGPDGPRFIECERNGKSINAGVWVQDGDDWLLILDEALSDED